MSASPTKALYTLLCASQPLRALVGTNVFSKQAVDMGKGDAYVILHRITSDHEHHLNGASQLAQRRYQIDVWAPTAAQVEEIEDAIREGLFKFRGTVESVSIRDIVFESVIDRDEIPTSGEPIASFGSNVELTVWYADTATSLVTA